MKLAYSTIAGLVSGVVDLAQKEDGIHFYKCTKKQMDGFYAISTALGDRSLTTTGVRLDFHTDSTRFAFGSSDGGKFDIYINGFLTYHLKGEDCRSFSCALPEGDTRVTLVFPSHSVGVLTEVELDDGAYAVRHTYAHRMLFFGDSITQGWDTEFDSLSYSWRTAMHYDADCIINGVGGAVFRPATCDSVPFDPEVIVIALGTNDSGFYKKMEDLEENASGVFRFFANEYPGKRLIAITPIWRADDQEIRPIGRFDALCDTVKACALKNGFEVFDGYEMVPHFKEFYADQNVHPNDAGAGLFADNLIKKLAL